MRKLPTFENELKISSLGKKMIAGVDEVGRACLAGPIVAGAVIFDLDNTEKLLRALRRVKTRDSKMLTATEREKASHYIKKTATAFGIGEVSSDEIDKFGIGAANILAFKRALDQIRGCDFALIDGRHFKGFDYDYRCIVKGDNISLSIAAASIIAKVYRDDLMKKLAEDHNKYGWAKNKGYGTRAHYDALLKHGPTQHHRKTFLKWMDEPNKLFDD